MGTKVNTDLLKKVKDNIIGRNTVFDGPFGAKKLVYCDYTASGKALEYIEKFIYDKVYPYYANTHTSTSISGIQTSKYREEARQIIHKSVNASDEEDVVVFTGSGTTAAVHKMINVLNLVPPKTEHTVVITGPYEHHSNILPWKETGVCMERIMDDAQGLVDLADLERKLREYFHRGFFIIASMSAASNVTGIITDTEAVTKLVHKYGGLSFWDFATAAPYLRIDMNPSAESAKDAVFISPHKFIGGVGTPGVLIAKRKLFNNKIPDKCGGGTVSWVTQQDHEYLRNIVEREEGGTPAIVESIRAGLVFQVKALIGEELIMEREEELCEQALQHWRGHPSLQLLGSHTATRLPIFSFLVYQPVLGKYLHHNYVSVLLNDLYGIQVRGGCACAGPYVQDLLEMDEDVAGLFVKHFLSEKRQDEGEEVFGVMKPGFVRLNFPYFMDDECVKFVLRAIDTVASDGWKLLPVYEFDPKTGNWKNRLGSSHKLGQLSDFGLDQNTDEMVNNESSEKKMSFQDIEKAASDVLQDYRKLAKESQALKDEPFTVTDSKLLWFLQPWEVCKHILNLEAPSSALPNLPFRPRRSSSTSQNLTLKLQNVVINPTVSSPCGERLNDHQQCMVNRPQLSSSGSDTCNTRCEESEEDQVDGAALSPQSRKTKRKLSTDEGIVVSPVKICNQDHRNMEETFVPVSNPLDSLVVPAMPKYQVSPLNISHQQDTKDKDYKKEAFPLSSSIKETVQNTNNETERVSKDLMKEFQTDTFNNDENAEELQSKKSKSSATNAKNDLTTADIHKKNRWERKTTIKKAQKIKKRRKFDCAVM